MVVTTESKVTINGKFYATGPRYSKTNQPTHPPKKKHKKNNNNNNKKKQRQMRRHDHLIFSGFR